MLKQSPTFSTIRTPSSYPASHKRYLQGSRGGDPVRMASAFATAIKGGRSAFLAGPMSVQEIAVASTPQIGRPFTFDFTYSARENSTRGK